MSFTKNNTISGVKIHKLNIISDDRGSVLHILRIDSVDFCGFGECYCSEILPNSIKAWKLHKEQTQQFAVPIGKIKLVMYDERKNSPSFGKTMISILGRPDFYNRIIIPPNIWYGFKCVSTIPALIVNCANLVYNKYESVAIKKDNINIPYKW